MEGAATAAPRRFVVRVGGEQVSEGTLGGPNDGNFLGRGSKIVIMIRGIAPSAIVIALLITVDSAPPVAAAQSKHPKSKAPAKRDTSQDEQRLRIRLQFSPNDRAAYEQLLKLLSARYAFRAQAQLDAQWLQNNPDDYPALVHLTSAATAALNDPELAIAAYRTYLSSVQRDPSDTTYDFVMSSLANELSKRGRADEALRQVISWWNGRRMT